MSTRKKVLIAMVATSVVYVAFAATTPNPQPGEPLTTRQKIAKYIKPRAVDKALDKLRDKAVDLVMYEGGKWVGGPFRGGDEQATRDVVTIVIDPRQWDQAPVKVAVKALQPSQTASNVDDTPGADPSTQSSRLPIQGRADQQPQPSPAPTPDPSSHPTQAPDREFVSEHSAPAMGDRPEHAQAENAPAAPQRAETPASAGQQQTLAAGQQTMQQAQPMDIVRGADGHYHAVPHESQPAPTPAPASPVAAAPAPAPAPQAHGADRGGPSGHDPMGGAHEIGHGVDKPDHNTPGGRDVSGIS